MFTLLIVGLVLSFLVAFTASVRGRSGVGWFILSLIVSPLVSGAILLLVGPARA